MMPLQKSRLLTKKSAVFSIIVMDGNIIWLAIIVLISYATQALVFNYLENDLLKYGFGVLVFLLSVRELYRLIIDNIDY